MKSLTATMICTLTEKKNNNPRAIQEHMINVSPILQAFTFVTEPKKETGYSSVCSTKVYHFFSLLHSGSSHLFTLHLLSLKYTVKRTLKTSLPTNPLPRLPPPKKNPSKQNGHVIAQLWQKNYKLNFEQQSSSLQRCS